jgi:hypothetical protein
VEYYATIYGKRSLAPLICVRVFSSAALDIVWKDAGLLRLETLPEFRWDHLRDSTPSQIGPVQGPSVSGQ